MQSRFIPLMAVFAGGLAYSLIPSGSFGAYRVMGDAAVAGAAALVTGALLVAFSKRRAAIGRRA